MPLLSNDVTNDENIYQSEMNNQKLKEQPIIDDKNIDILCKIRC